MLLGDGGLRRCPVRRGRRREEDAGSGLKSREHRVDGGRKARGFTRVSYIPGGAGLDCHQQKYLSSTWFVKLKVPSNSSPFGKKICGTFSNQRSVAHLASTLPPIIMVQCRETDPIERETIVLSGDLLC